MHPLMIFSCKAKVQNTAGGVITVVLHRIQHNLPIENAVPVSLSLSLNDWHPTAPRVAGVLMRKRWQPTNKLLCLQIRGLVVNQHAVSLSLTNEGSLRDRWMRKNAFALRRNSNQSSHILEVVHPWKLYTYSPLKHIHWTGSCCWKKLLKV